MNRRWCSWCVLFIQRRRVTVVAAVTLAIAFTGPMLGVAASVRVTAAPAIRVLLPAASALGRIGSAGSMVFTERDGQRLLARARPNESWRIERDGLRLRVVRGDGMPTVWTTGPILVRPETNEPITLGAKSYRGELFLHTADTGAFIVNRLSIEDYVRGVVPLEIGGRLDADSAAVQAQAVTARSYAYVHLVTDPLRAYDVTAGVNDQVYGGVGAENAVTNRAIEATRGLVLTYAGRTVNAPYHSTCGGTTATASEVWRSTDEPYLRRVSDRIPGSDRFYCDIAPRFSWTRTLDARTLNAALSQYLVNYVDVPGRVPGVARSVSIASRTLSGRAERLTIATDRGTFSLRGNEMRYVLREPGGEILNSTYFSVETSAGLDGALARLTVRGTGYGHGVGMCQWGAIGRARAGQDFRTILRSYYPGTSVGLAN
jgi:stage II sporulation protein D